ncbi:MAG TPA: DMT family transporter [Flavitalea sp.]|nr:DMT family transporter [Flavitalea sp.]
MSVSRNTIINWGLFIALSFIWGSSFILMKEGLKALTAYQVAALRIGSGGLVLLPAAVRHLKAVPSKKFGYTILSGLLGSFVPAFLYCIAETNIDSSLAAFLNALTPISTIIIGVLFFKSKLPLQKVFGVLLGLSGMALLLLGNRSVNLENLSFSSLVLIATVCYSLNANIVNRFLADVGSTKIAAVSFSVLLIPCLIILFVTGFFQLSFSQANTIRATGAGILLGVGGTAIASIIFFQLLKRAGIIFSSLVTYGIPFVALMWGIIAGENITLTQIGGLVIILIAVYIANKS